MIKQLIMNIVVYFLLFFSFCSFIACAPTPPQIIDTISASSDSMKKTVDISQVTTATSISIQYQNTNVDLSCTFVMASFDSFYDPDVSTLYSLYNKKPSDYSGVMDLVSMQLGRTQFINMIKQAGKNNLYLTIMAFDPFVRKVTVSYQIDIATPGGLSCYNCVTPAFQSNTLYCGCLGCSPGYQKPTCDLSTISVSQAQTQTAALTGPGLLFFEIHSQSDITISIKASAGYAQAYFQFIQYQGQFASYSNVATGNSIQGKFILIGGTKGVQVSASSSGTPMSVTVAKFNAGTINVSVSYESVKTTNIIAIILGVLGGVLFIGLIIGGCYIIRNVRNSQVLPSQRQIPLQRDQLIAQQIQRFFPTVILKDIYVNQGYTMQNLLEQSKHQTNGQNDCVICICPVQLEQPAKVTYCNHVFHAKCLTGWFQKQKNCPYCRQQFTKASTIKLYKKVKEQSGKSILKKDELVQQIMRNKSSSKFIEEKQIANMSQLNQVESINS